MFAVDICLEELVPLGMKDRKGCTLNSLCAFFLFCLFCLTLLSHIHSHSFNHYFKPWNFSPALVLPFLILSVLQTEGTACV